MSERVKIILAVVLLVAMVGVVGYQIARVTGAFSKKEAPPPPPAVPQNATPAGETEPAGEVPGSQAAPETKESLQSKISFVDKEIEERYRQSQYFVRNPMGAMRDPFLPPATLAPPKQLEGTQQTMTAQTFLGDEGPTGAVIEGEVPEISLLPLPSEIAEEETHFTLIGYSLGRSGSTGLFQLGETATEGEGAAAPGGVIMAHEGWLVGNDYIFLGIRGDKAELLNRKSDNIILLSTGETV